MIHRTLRQLMSGQPKWIRAIELTIGVHPKETPTIDYSNPDEETAEPNQTNKPNKPNTLEVRDLNISFEAADKLEKNREAVRM